MHVPTSVRGEARSLRKWSAACESAGRRDGREGVMPRASETELLAMSPTPTSVRAKKKRAGIRNAHIRDYCCSLARTRCARVKCPHHSAPTHFQPPSHTGCAMCNSPIHSRKSVAMEASTQMATNRPSIHISTRTFLPSSVAKRPARQPQPTIHSPFDYLLGTHRHPLFAPRPALHTHTHNAAVLYIYIPSALVFRVASLGGLEELIIISAIIP